jgi:hypothetical protein
MKTLSGMAAASTSARIIAICDQPTNVMMFSSRTKAAPLSEFFGVNERVEQIDAETDADQQADDGFGH